MKNEITIDGVVYVKKEPAITHEEPKSWPQVGDECYRLEPNGFRATRWDALDFDFSAMERGSYFPTLEEAQLADQARMAVTKIKNYAREKWGEFKPDWESRSEKWSVSNTHFNYGVDYTYFPSEENIIDYCPKIGYFAKKEHVDEIIEKFPKELDTIFS